MTIPPKSTILGASCLLTSVLTDIKATSIFFRLSSVVSKTVKKFSR